MILRSLTLEDVGTYAGRETLDFGAPDPAKPVTLVGGLNGAGKTTIVRSLFHVLYGKHALGLIGRRGGYDTFLRDVTHRGRDRGALELRLSVPGQGLGNELTVRRSWEPRKSRLEDRVDVYRDGQYDEALSEAWDDIVDGFAPRRIAPLFFFDGEQVETLADLDSASGILRSALGALLGLDVVDQLTADLGAVQRKVVREAATDLGRERLDLLDRDVEALTQLRAEAIDERDALQHSLAAVRAEHASVEEAYRAAGGNLYDDRESLEGETRDARDRRDAARTGVVALAARPEAPLLLVSSLVGELAQVVDRDPSAAARLLHVLQARDAWLLDELHRNGVTGDIRAAVAMSLQRDREAREPSEERDFAPAAAPADVGRAAGRAADSLRGELLIALDQLAAGEDEHEQSLRRVARLPTEESLRILLEMRLESGERVEQCAHDLAAAEALIEQRGRGLERATAARDAEVRRLGEANIAVGRSERLTAHAARARETLQALRQAANARHASRVAAYATEALQSLLRKEGLVEALKIDGDSLAVQLEGHNAERLRPSMLSAGERQLTALALLWSLTRAAGRPLPIVIDTPLGRLDASHRRHVVERYLPNASHQVVVLSTDTEIDATLLPFLEPHVGQAHTLVYDDEQRATTIQPGYLTTVST